MKHGAQQRYCELHMWVAERWWPKHIACEIDVVAGTVLMNPGAGVKDTVEGVRVLAITEDSNGNEVFVIEKMFSGPEAEKTAGHHKHQAHSRKRFAAKYGAWRKA